MAARVTPTRVVLARSNPAFPAVVLPAPPPRPPQPLAVRIPVSKGGVRS